MAAPSSATILPKQIPNNSSPLVSVEGEVELTTSDGKPVRGRINLDGLLTITWRYIFGLFAQTSPGISATWTQTVSNPPTQAEIRAIVAQVELLSQQLARN